VRSADLGASSATRTGPRPWPPSRCDAASPCVGRATGAEATCEGLGIAAISSGMRFAPAAEEPAPTNRATADRSASEPNSEGAIATAAPAAMARSALMNWSAPCGITTGGWPRASEAGGAGEQGAHAGCGYHVGAHLPA
jgi:hypothetical protein